MKKKGLLVVCLACAPLLAGAGYSAYALTQVNNEAIRINAKLETMKEGEQKSELEKLLEELQKFKDTFLIPLLGGSIGVCSVVPVITALFNYLRTKRVVGQIKDADEKLNKAEATLKSVGEMLEKATVIMSSTDGTKKAVENVTGRIDELIKKDAVVSQNIENIKEVIKLFADLEIKLAKVSKQAVASGVVEDVTKIKSLIGKM